MSRFRSFVVGVSLLTSLAAGAAFAEGTGAPPQLGVRDVDFIRAHYHRLENSARQGLPNGLARKAELPKGLAKRVALSQPLPPGLRSAPLDDDLVVLLTPLPDGYEYQEVDGGLVVIVDGVQTVFDILPL